MKKEIKEEIKEEKKKEMKGKKKEEKKKERENDLQLLSRRLSFKFVFIKNKKKDQNVEDLKNAEESLNITSSQLGYFAVMIDDLMLLDVMLNLTDIAWLHRQLPCELKTAASTLKHGLATLLATAAGIDLATATECVHYAIEDYEMAIVDPDADDEDLADAFGFSVRSKKGDVVIN